MKIVTVLSHDSYFLLEVRKGKIGQNLLTRLTGHPPVGITILESYVREVMPTDEATPAHHEALFGEVDKVLSSEEFCRLFFNSLLDRNGVSLIGQKFTRSCNEPIL